MIDSDALALDAAFPHEDRPETDPHPRLGGRRLTDLSAAAGAGVWLALVVAATRETVA